MADAAALRAEALRLRTLARGITDEEALVPCVLDPDRFP
jgi:hypothetical protein